MHILFHIAHICKVSHLCACNWPWVLKTFFRILITNIRIFACMHGYRNALQKQICCQSLSCPLDIKIPFQLFGFDECASNSSFHWNAFPYCPQMNRFSPVWIRLYIYTPLSCINTSFHTLHNYKVYYLYWYVKGKINKSVVRILFHTHTSITLIGFITSVGEWMLT